MHLQPTTRTVSIEFNIPSARDIYWHSEVSILIQNRDGCYPCKIVELNRLLNSYSMDKIDFYVIVALKRERPDGDMVKIS